MSFVMLVFTLVPAIAPLLGAGIIAFAGWRGVFIAFVVFSLINALWLYLRLEETLPAEKRRPFDAATLWQSARTVFAHPVVRLSIAVQTLCYGILFAMLSSVQQVYDITYGRSDSFPLWFGGVAIVAGSANLLNAVLVMRLGMQRLVTITLGAQIVISGLVFGLGFVGLPPLISFGVFVVWQTSVFFQAGMTLGNLNALAMEPLGEIAGMAASIIAGVSTIAAMFVAIPIGLAFDGTEGPVALGIFVAASVAFALMLWLRRVEARLGS